MENASLKHHGIIGMKWGVRRFQNKDGSLTAAGKKRLGKNTDDNDETTIKPAKQKPKSIKELSDAELRERIARLELEKRYKDLARAEAQASTSEGKKFVKRVLEKSGENISVQLTTYALGAGVNAAAKALGVKNSKVTLKNPDGKPIIDDDGFEKVAEIFEDIVNPRKGQKDK